MCNRFPNLELNRKRFVQICILKIFASSGYLPGANKNTRSISGERGAVDCKPFSFFFSLIHSTFEVFFFCAGEWRSGGGGGVDCQCSR